MGSLVVFALLNQTLETFRKILARLTGLFSFESLGFVDVDKTILS